MLSAVIGRHRPMAQMLLCEFILNSQPEPPGETFLFHTLLELYLEDHLPDESPDVPAGGPAPPASRNVRRSASWHPCCMCCD